MHWRQGAGERPIVTRRWGGPPPGLSPRSCSIPWCFSAYRSCWYLLLVLIRILAQFLCFVHFRQQVEIHTDVSPSISRYQVNEDPANPAHRDDLLSPGVKTIERFNITRIASLHSLRNNAHPLLSGVTATDQGESEEGDDSTGVLCMRWSTRPILKAVGRLSGR